jgi:hypothetical protein
MFCSDVLYSTVLLATVQYVQYIQYSTRSATVALVLYIYMANIFPFQKAYCTVLDCVDTMRTGFSESAESPKMELIPLTPESAHLVR